MLKFLTDLWSCQEISWDKRPDVIIKMGVFLGGTTLFYAKMLDMIVGDRVIAMHITLENMDPDLKVAANATVFEGSSSSADMADRVGGSAFARR